MEMNPPKPHAILLASPGMGHLRPMLQLGHRLVRLHDLQITLFIITNETNTSSASKSHLFTSNSDFFHIHLITPPPPPQDLTSQPDSGIIRNLITTMRACIPRIRSAISEMKLAPTALVVDLFGTDFWELADEFGMLKFGFMTTNALFLAAFISVPFLVNKLSRKEYESLEMIDIPGCKSVAYEDVFELANRDDPDHIFARSMATNFINADGVLINTWYALEPNTIKLLKDGRLMGRVYPIGPMTEQIDKVVSSEFSDNKEILNWLDKQPEESVIYVSFGSGRSLTHQQIQELALGLESSKKRFIWVLRPPTDEVTEYFFSAGNQDEALDYLPDGFVTRTKDVGLVVPIWAPQATILAHTSVGGFLTHCGWNSTLESVTNGVPMIAWPLYGDQNLISIMLTDELKVAIRPSVRPSRAVVGREEVKELVLKLMDDGGEGNIMRNRAKEIQCTADKVLHAQKTGSAMDSLHHFATCLRHKRSGQKRQSKLLRCFTCCVTRH